MPTRAASACTTPLSKDRDRLGYPKPRANGPLRVILMRTRPAEVRQNAVTQKLRDVALEPGDLARHGVLVVLDEVTQLLRVAPRCERG